MSSLIGARRPSPRTSRSVASFVVMSVSALSLTGCVGILPNSNTKAGEKLIHGAHKVVYSVEAPHGSVIKYSYGDTQLTAKANNLGKWSKEVGVEGIQKLEITVTVEGEVTATCNITVDGTSVSTANSLSGISESAHCKGTTTKT